jgi:Disulphide bond corrector protein DsbC
MKYCLLAMLLALGAPLHADLISLVASIEPQPAKRGGNVALKLQFTVDKGLHAYHKDNPGYSKPLKIEFTDLAGLTQVGDAAWPKYHEHRDEKDPSWIEYELSGVFEIVYTLRVPANAGEKLALSGKYEAQVCDVNACQDREGTFSADVKVDIAAPPEEHKQPTGSEDTNALKKELAEARKALEEKVGGLSDEVAALKKELATSRKASEELSKTLKEYIAAQHEKAAASGTKDDHGFYEDYDFALAEAKKQGKLLLIDFNGEY